MAKQRGLGKGLSSLIPTLPSEEPAPIDEEESRGVPQLSAKVSDLSPNPWQPRKFTGNDQIDDLVTSIKEHGVIQPILVRQVGEALQIISGERRWRAAEKAGLEEIPVRVMEVSDAEAMEFALIENLQRTDLSPIEIARGICDLITRFSLTHDDVSRKLGMSRAAVTNKIRLLQLPPEVIQMIEEDLLSEGHARALLSLPDTDKIIEQANLAIQKNMSVRQLEEMIRNAAAAAKLDAVLPRKDLPPSEFQKEIDRIEKNFNLSVHIGGSRRSMGISIKGLKKWQIQLILEYIENNGEEFFPAGE